MLIHGFPITAKLPEELGFGERFWYWQGASGRNYIHSIYHAGACPPSPGAIYVAVRRMGITRQAVAIGRFPNFWDGSASGPIMAKLRVLGAEEIHVHLLARNNEAADDVLDDLTQAFHGEERVTHRHGGFNEACQPQLSAT